MKNYFFERGRDFFDVFLSRALARDKKTSKKSRSLEKKFFFHQILLFIAYYTQIEYLGSFIPHDQALNMAVIYAFQWVNDDFQLLFNDNPRIQIY